jgi:hypothetical protein
LDAREADVFEALAARCLRHGLRKAGLRFKEYPGGKVHQWIYWM